MSDDLNGKKPWELKTKSGFPLAVVRSALQKNIRYQQIEEAGYWLAELVDSGYVNYALTTLACICVEDCIADRQTVAAVMSILDFYKGIYKEKKLKAEYRPALGTVLVYLCGHEVQSRLGDDFWCFIEMKRKSGWRCEPGEFSYDEHVSKEHKTPDQQKRAWRFWVRVASVLRNPVAAGVFGIADYSAMMRKIWLKGSPNHPDEPDYEPIDPASPHSPITEKPYIPDDDGSKP